MEAQKFGLNLLSLKHTLEILRMFGDEDIIKREMSNVECEKTNVKCQMPNVKFEM
jgi:hypothetical protein